MGKQTALYLISGFLGAGKTTLVRRLLEEENEKKVGVVVNEFGKISIDGPILKKPNLEMIEVNRGSIFCSCLKGSFADALVEMADRDLDYLIVESSGLADPSNIEEILQGVHERVPDPYHYCGSITVVDASQFFTQIETIETTVKQIECADLTWVNKIDLVDEVNVDEIRQEITAINPETEIRESSFFAGLLDILGLDFSRGKFPKLRASLNTPENKPKSMSISFYGSISKGQLESFIHQVLGSAYRVKGFVLADQGLWEVHGVGEQVDFYPLERKHDASELVIISKVGPGIIRIVDSAWKDCVGIPMRMGNG